MNPAIRRMALNLSPWIWAFILYTVAIGGLMDFFWLNRPVAGFPPLIVGILFGIGPSMSAWKVALWRILPVSQRQIDLARWTQGIIFPLVSLSLIMLLPALVMGFLGTLHVRWPAILLMIAAQAGCGVIIFCGQVIVPLMARRIGGWSVLALMVAIFPIGFAPIWMRNGSMQFPILPALAFVEFAAASLLYATAGRWPLPVVGWANFWSARETVVRHANPGLSGWQALLLAQSPMVLLCWCAIPGVPLLLRFALGDHGDLSFMAVVGVLSSGLLTVTMFSQSMRGLRALPLSGLAITISIMASLISVQLVGAILFTATLALLQPYYQRPNYALLPIGLVPLLFAFSLRFSPRVAQFINAIGLFSVPLGAFLLRTLHFRIVDTAALVVVLVALGFAWSYWEIVSGRHAYRAQPLMPVRWRGR